MNFIVQGENCCMTNALNQYFNRWLFLSREQFVATQSKLNNRHSKRAIGEYDVEMLLRVQVGNNLFKRQFDFQSDSMVDNQWPTRIATKHGRCIVDYITDDGTGHVEAAKFSNGQLVFPRCQDGIELPYTSSTPEEYMVNNRKCGLAKHFKIFHYSQINWN
jgi:hypothetical protein